MNSFHMTMVLKYGVEEMSLSQTNVQLEQINEPCSARSVHSYTLPNYVCLRCHRTSSPNYPLGLLIGLQYTNLRASTVLQGPEQCCGLPEQPEQYLVTVTVTVTINGLVKLTAFNAHICPYKYLVSF